MANSFVRYTGNNSTTAYSIPFSYISTNDLTVTLAGVATTAFTLNAAGTTLTFNSPPASNVAIEIRRTTSQTTRLTDYASGSVLTENDLDTDSEQAFFMGQEAIDDANDVIKISNVNFQYDATNKRITNVADPVNAQDLATKNYLENTFLTPANKTALTTVNANIANINAVNNNSSNINSAVSNATNINTVATNIGSVNTVATDIAKVITVANDLAEAVSEVETVADDLNEATSEIDTVATSITNVDTVGNNIANVNTVASNMSSVQTVSASSMILAIPAVAGIASDVTAVANISSDVQAVENIASNVTTVAGISSDVTGVANISTAVSNVNSNSSNINAVNSNATNINTVAGNNSNISTVSGISGNVSTVAGISSNVTTVAGISANVTAVAGDATDIGTVATDLAGSNNIGTVAGAITNVNNVGGSIASVNSVATNLASVNSFANTYLGASSSAPTQDPDGSALDLGDLYFDTGSNQLKVYSSTGWVNAGSSVNGTSDRFKYTVSGTPTTISGNDDNSKSLSYDAGFIDVFLNGIKMVNGTDVTVTSGNSVVFASALTNGDVVDIITFGTFNIASMNASNLTSGTVPSARVSGAYNNVTSVGTLTSFASTGIDDNATGTSLTIASDGRTTLDATNEKALVVHHSDGSTVRIGMNNNSTNSNEIAFESTDFTVKPGGFEKFRIDSVGNTLINTTSTKGDDAGTFAPVLTVNGGSYDGLIEVAGNRSDTDGAGVARLQFIQNSNSATYKEVAEIRVETEGATANQRGGRINFRTRADGSTSTTERMRITSSGDVFIGDSNPAYSSRLTVSGNGSADTGLFMYDGGAGTYLNITTNGANGVVDLEANARTGSYPPLTFTVSTAERMRISGNTVMIGKTSNGIANDGVELKTNDVSRFTQTSRNVIEINRKTDDGDIVQFKKDGTTVGSIGAESGSLSVRRPTGTNGLIQTFGQPTHGIVGAIGNTSVDFYITNNSSGSNNTGLLLSNNNKVVPMENASTSDNVTDLGSTTSRWKDLYLGGGLYVGGTGSANKLEDYEEGTFTPSWSTGTSNYVSGGQQGRYTKIGNIVFFNIRISTASITSLGTAWINGLPFTSANISNYYQSAISVFPIEGYQDLGDAGIKGQISPNTSRIELYVNHEGTGANYNTLDTADMDESGLMQINLGGFYHV